MARPNSTRKIQRYSDEFNLKAVNLTEIEGIQLKDVAESLDIHPFMLSRWRKDVRRPRFAGVATAERQVRWTTKSQDTWGPREY